MSTLRSANEQFEQIMLIRSDAIFEAAMGAAKVAREAAQMTFGKLCEMVNALAIVNGDGAYKYIIDRMAGTSRLCLTVRKPERSRI